MRCRYCGGYVSSGIDGEPLDERTCIDCWDMYYGHHESNDVDAFGNNFSDADPGL